MPGRSLPAALRFALALVPTLLLAAPLPAKADEPGAARLLDGFENAADWSTIASDGVKITLSSEPGRTGKALRIDYDFTRGSGFGIVRREFNLPLPENYRFTYFIRGEGPSNTIEFKLLDESGDNVWWLKQPDFAFAPDWTKVSIPRRKISFAWGPSGGKPLTNMRWLEIAITASSGGKGTVWLDDLTFEPLPVTGPYTRAPSPTATSGMARPIPNADGAVSWTSAHGDARPALTIDYGQVREFGGVRLAWENAAFARDCTIEGSLDGKTFTPLGTIHGSSGGTDYIVTPDSAARVLRLTCDRLGAAPADTVVLSSLSLLPLALGDSRNDLLAAIASDARQGWYPRYTRGTATYWTVLGVPGDSKEALISADGSVEVDKGAFTLEPFVLDGGMGTTPPTTPRLLTWAESTCLPFLEDGDLPIPSVRRDMGGLDLTITAVADGDPGRSNLLVRYELANTGDRDRMGTMYIAIRPFQVNPPYQNLNTVGGAAIIRQISMRPYGGTVNVDDRVVVPLVPPDSFGASPLEQGEIVEHAARGILPATPDVTDPQGLASAALAYPYRLAPGETKSVAMLVPLHGSASMPRAIPAEQRNLAMFDSALARAKASWRQAESRTTIDLPEGYEGIAESVRANLAYILINRDGPAIQPGSRSYERTWIRDGSLTSAALLALGHEAEVKDFIEWFGAYQYDNGKIPCCVDRRGPDPVAEHDSHGQYIWAVWRYFQFTGDSDFLRRAWPRVLKAAAYIDFLRSQRTTMEYQSGEGVKAACFGILPESISHEGYSAKPMHSYWDSMFALRGLSDAVRIAEALGETADAARLKAQRDQFRDSLAASIRKAMAIKNIDYIPGCVELGDFDSTSTTVALFPCQAQDALPEGALQRTFDKAWDNFSRRRSRETPWEAYTPYEWRQVGAMVQLGQRERALEMLAWYFGGQRPAAWRGWAEVVWNDPQKQAFIGDMPHTWCGSDFINSVRLMLAWEREHDDALVLGAGVPRTWITDAKGVRIANLGTVYGPVSFRARGDATHVTIEVDPVARPGAGGVVWSIPDPQDIERLSLNGKEIPLPPGGEVPLGALPAKLDVWYRAAK